MRIEIKAHGRGKTASINNAVGEVRLRADGDADAKVLAKLGFLVQYPDMMSALLEISTALIRNRKQVTARDRKTLCGIIARMSAANRKGGAE